MQRRTAAHIHLDAIRANYAHACSLAPQAAAIAVIKADAYGHGILRVAESLQDMVRTFAVATVDEALVLREAGISNAILVLEGATTSAACEVASAQNLTLMVHAPEQAAMLRAAQAAWIKVDTGMHRLGIKPAELDSVLAQLQAASVDLQAVCTHFACADDPESDATRKQLDTFRSCTKGCELPLSAANSAGILAWPESHMDYTRPGIMLYGSSPFSNDVAAARPLQPAMTFSTEIIALRAVPAGESVGYGARWTADRPSVIATLAAGYADGYPRHAPSGTPVFVGGKLVPLVGTVSMDMVTIDLTDHPGAAVGDPVELWGRNVSVNEVATRAGTISYELLTGVTARVPRLYG